MAACCAPRMVFKMSPDNGKEDRPDPAKEKEALIYGTCNMVLEKEGGFGMEVEMRISRWEKVFKMKSAMFKFRWKKKEALE